MGVIMQAFYWDCPSAEKRDYLWWPYIEEKVSELSNAGFTALWLPPAHKAANLSGVSMGYDPYDYYDLGNIEQKGKKETWFGSRKALEQLISTAHVHKLNVIADLVINQCSGADSQEKNPIDGQTRWTTFRPASNQFPRNWECFHPCMHESYDNETFGELPDFCHRNPFVYQEVMDLCKWLIEEIGFDGFRYDFVKGYGTWIIPAIQEYRYVKGDGFHKPFGVGEMWDSTRTIKNWLNEVNAWNDNEVSAFDFDLRYLLKDICDVYGVSFYELINRNSLHKEKPYRAVTFVENHDFREEGAPINNDKLMAYSYILTHEGYPCVFWKDYFNYNLKLSNTENGIEALVGVHEKYAGGYTQILYVDNNLYIMQRTGTENQPGLIYVLNNYGDRWNGANVTTQWRNTCLKPVAWWSAGDLSKPEDKITNTNGEASFWAPPRGYAVYAI